MWILLLQFSLYINIISSTVSPSAMYQMVDSIIERFLNDTCVLIFSDRGYLASPVTSAIYVEPYENFVDNGITDEEVYKKVILTKILDTDCNGYIIQTKDPSKQLRLIQTTFILVNGRGRRRFIFLPTTAKPRICMGDCSETLNVEGYNYQSILAEKSVSYIPDIILAVPNGKNIELLTHYFGGSDDECRQIVYLDTYDVNVGKFVHGVDLFPDKVRNLNGKSLKIAVFHYPPYIVLFGDDWKNVSQIDGTEWRVAVEFAELHNCSLESIVDEAGLWGTIHDNRTGNGIIGNVVEDRADIGLGALYTWYHESLYLDLSMAYVRTGITCLVPLPRQLPQWMSPILPFTAKLWAALFIMTILSTIFAYIVNFSASKIYLDGHLRVNMSEAAIIVAGIMFQQGLSKEPNVASWAALSTAILIMSLLISTAYNSSLASAMTIPRYEDPIDTPIQMASRGLIWAANHDAWVFSILDAKEPELVTIVKNFRTLKFSELVKESAHGRWGFGIERLPAGYYAIQEYLHRESVEKMHLMANDLYWEYSVAMLRKSSPLTQWYSLRILQMLASGIPAKWEADVVARHLDYGTQLGVHKGHHVDHGPVKLTVGQVQGTFFLWVFGLLLSLLVFLSEMWIHKRDNKLKIKHLQRRTHVYPDQPEKMNQVISEVHFEE